MTYTDTKHFQIMNKILRIAGPDDKTQKFKYVLPQLQIVSRFGFSRFIVLCTLIYAV
jgi:hypothetical protein